ncbi:MAG: hypothetical protein WC378_00135 [Opitutaceae bacterium]|jgi:hypothetical protein
MSYPTAAPLDSPVSGMVQRQIDCFVGAEEVTPSDTTAVLYRGLLATVAGVIKVTMWDDTVVSVPVLAGVIYPLLVKLVWSTGTTATGIVGLY